MSRAFDSWILENASSIGLSIEDLSWVNDFYPGSSDLTAKIRLRSKEYDGRGHAQSKDLSLKIAVSEAIERAVCLHYVPTSNGVACHSILENAQINACNELLERDLFLSHFLTKTPFNRLKDESKYIPKSVFDFVLKSGDVIQIFGFKENNMGQGFVCLVSNGKHWGGVLGLSFGQESCEKLIQKSILEAFRQYYFEITIQKFKNQISLDEFISRKKWGFSDHGHLFMNVDYFNRIKFLFQNGDNNSENHEIKYNKERFSFETFKQPFPELRECPLYVVICRSEDLQQLGTGPLENKLISMVGLKRFLGNDVVDLNLLPHPIN